MALKAIPFWQSKSLAEMDEEEWESLCDGCGKCCLVKLQDEDTDELVFTSMACQQLDINACRCKVYEKRFEHVPDCLDLARENVAELHWLPSTCAYRLVQEGSDLPSWHHLKTGDKQDVHKTYCSVRHLAVSESQVNEEDWDLYIIEDLN